MAPPDVKTFAFGNNLTLRQAFTVAWKSTYGTEPDPLKIYDDVADLVLGDDAPPYVEAFLNKLRGETIN